VPVWSAELAPRKDAEVSAEGGGDKRRLEGVILRSQLLVLLQRRHFCDAAGRPIGRDYSEQQELDMEVRAWGRACVCARVCVCACVCVCVRARVGPRANAFLTQA
jgi:hypothetical protein